MVYRHVSPLNPGLMKTYEVASPVTSHFRPATCEEVGCRNNRNGWVTVVDEATDLGKRQAAYIRQECRPVLAKLSAAMAGTRRYSESRNAAGLTEFRFGPGQQCFAQHRTRIHRPDIFLVRGGDWRGNPRGTQVRTHTRGEYWVEDMQENLDGLRTLAERG